MARVTSYKCDSCMELMDESERSIVTLSTPAAKWAADLCSKCIEDVKGNAAYALKQRKKAPKLAAARAA